jgi:hypothetical protein
MHIQAICFERHLFHPMIQLGDQNLNAKDLPLTMTPHAFDAPSEVKFFIDLRGFYSANKDGLFKGKEIFLLRNAGKGRGVSFARAGNFYPDYMLWILEGKKQQLVFIDPKGIARLDEDDPKFSLYAKIKEYEDKLRERNTTGFDMILNAFILSCTRIEDLEKFRHWKKVDMENKNILFMEDKDYLDKMFAKII